MAEGLLARGRNVTAPCRHVSGVAVQTYTHHVAFLGGVFVAVVVVVAALVPVLQPLVRFTLP